MKHILLLFTIFIGFYSFAQEEPNFDCHNITYNSNKNIWKGNNKFLYDYIQNFPLLDSGKVYYNIPLTFHIFLNSRESIIVLNKDIKKVVDFLNNIYKTNNTGIQFYVADILFYKEKKHLKTGYSIEAFFLGKKDFNKNSLNLYYVNVLELNLFFKKFFYRGMYSSLTKSIMIIRHSSKTTLAHEIGHCFGLLHPHTNWKKGKSKQECVSRLRTKNNSNKLICEINGDCLSDTPAEPDLRYFTNKNCEYTGFLTDNWGELYVPNTNNIMSYPGDKCRTTFTTLQKAVMLYTISTIKNSEKWLACSKNKIFFFDKYEPDDVMSMSSEIFLEHKQYHTFNWFYNFMNALIENKSDWIFFKNNKIQKLIFSFEQAESNFPFLNVFIFDSNYKCISFSEFNSPRKIELRLPKGKYYIKIENQTPQIAGFLDYFVKLTSISN